MKAIEIKNDIQIDIEFRKTNFGKILHDEVSRLYDLEESFDNIDEEDWTEETTRQHMEVHREYCKAHTNYENARNYWLVKGIESGRIIDKMPDIG